MIVIKKRTQCLKQQKARKLKQWKDYKKAIAHAGVTSRRKAEELIVKGRVKVNGQVVKELGTQVSNKIPLKLMVYQFIKKNMVIIYSITKRGYFCGV